MDQLPGHRGLNLKGDDDDCGPFDDCLYCILATTITNLAVGCIAFFARVEKRTFSKSSLLSASPCCPKGTALVLCQAS